MNEPADRAFTIREFRADDLPVCRKLYLEGLISGKIAENDTGLDIDDIESAYVRPEGNQFWVAVAPPVAGTDGACEGDQVVGMIGVQQYEDGIGEIRRLRVAQAHRRRGIGSALVEAALKFCEERQYLKITLDTFMEREPAIALFRKFRFRHSRTRKLGDKEMMYFYLDLYAEEKGRES